MLTDIEPNPVREYRDDIQGLRGLSIILVLLFHCNEFITGGFIGVDVFFVISGFVITSSLIKKESLSIVDFFGRRIKRLLPASLFVLITIIFSSYFILNKKIFINTLYDAYFVPLMSSNINFMRGSDTGYFAQIQKTPSVFLHFWSLGIEEQFYFICPFILLLKKPFRIIIFILLWIVSFIFSFGIPNNTPSYVIFYSPCTRFWELITGCLLAHIPVDNWRIINGISNIGLFLICLVSILYTPLTTFSTILPVLGASMILMDPNPLLTHPILLYIGNISYSLYLWHWPIIILSNILLNPYDYGNFSFTFKSSVIGILFSFLITILCYNFLEIKIKTNTFLKKRNGLSILLGLLAIILTLLYIFIFSVGMNKCNEGNTTVECQAMKTIWVLPDYYTVYNPGNIPVILAGDSHSAHLGPAFENIAYNRNWTVHLIWSPSCPIVYNIGPSRWSEQCHNTYIDLINKIRELKPVYTFFSHKYISHTRQRARFLERQPPPENESKFPNYIEDGFKRMINYTNSMNSTFVFLEDVISPVNRFSGPLCVLDKGDCSFYRDINTLTEEINIRKNIVRNSGGNYIETGDLVCGPIICPSYTNDLLIRMDEDHLSPQFSKSISGQLERLLEN